MKKLNLKYYFGDSNEFDEGEFKITEYIR